MSFSLLSRALLGRSMARNTMSVTARTIAPRAPRIATTFGALSRSYADDAKEKKRSKGSSKPRPSLTTESLLSQEMVDGMANEGASSSKSEGPAASSSAESERPDRSEGEGEQSSNGAKPEWAGTAKRADYQAARDATRTRRLVWSFATIFFIGGLTVVYMSRNWDQDEWLAHRDIPNGYAPLLMYKRFKARLDGVTSYYAGPSIEPELPPLPKDDNYQRFTLILGVEDLLLHSEWTRKDGWKTYKRPGLDYFLMYLAQYYEIVLFSSESANFAERMVMKLDPYHAFMTHALFRESTYYIDGHIVKDISNINRDLSKVIMVDVDPAAYSKQPHNAIPVKRWNGAKEDTELVKLIPLLEYIANSDVKDVRKVLQTFEGCDDYANEYERRELEFRKKAYELWDQQKNQASLSSWIAKLFGMPVPQADKPMIAQDFYRQEGIKNYERMQQFIKENGDKILDEEKQREREFLEQQNFTLGNVIKGVVDPQAQAAAAAQAAQAAQAASTAQASN
ncbi:NLI interacting factor-like phosphatase-domain-containing protein [Lipomyces starkeyi]